MSELLDECEKSRYFARFLNLVISNGINPRFLDQITNDPLLFLQYVTFGSDLGKTLFPIEDNRRFLNPSIIGFRCLFFAEVPDYLDFAEKFFENFFRQNNANASTRLTFRELYLKFAIEFVSSFLKLDSSNNAKIRALFRRFEFIDEVIDALRT